MGDDKGALDLYGCPQAERCVRILEPVCKAVLVSVRRSQAEFEPYRGLHLVFDDESVRGPAAGLLSAWDKFPDSALLVWAVDMPYVDANLIHRLVEGRNSAKPATAFRNAEGMIEPLCAIFEPAIAPKLRKAAADRSPSLRRILEQTDIELIEPAHLEQLESINTPEALAAARAAIARG